MLVLGKFNNMSNKISQLKIRETIVSEIFQQSTTSRRHNVRPTVTEARRREELTGGAKKTGGTCRTAILCFGSRCCRNIATTTICQSSYKEAVLSVKALGKTSNSKTVSVLELGIHPGAKENNSVVLLSTFTSLWLEELDSFILR